MVHKMYSARKLKKNHALRYSTHMCVDDVLLADDPIRLACDICCVRIGLRHALRVRARTCEVVHATRKNRRRILLYTMLVNDEGFADMSGYRITHEVRFC
jgi:hypothetical protein